jgi:hypothetical protein
MTPRRCSNEYSDHQTRYRDSLEAFVVVSLELFILIPRVMAERIAILDILQALVKY